MMNRRGCSLVLQGHPATRNETLVLNPAGGLQGAPAKEKVKFVPESKIMVGAGPAPKEEKKPLEYIVPVYKKKVIERLPFHTRNLAILGQTGSGKSVEIENILRNIVDIDLVYLFVPTNAVDTQNNYEEILDDREIEFTNSEIEDLPSVIEEVLAVGAEQKKAKDKKKFLFVFDDFGSSLVKSDEIIRFAKMSRKIPCQIIFGIQSYEQLAPPLWKQLQNVSIFTNTSENEVKKVLERVSLTMPKESVLQAIETHKKQYNFINIDLLNGQLMEKFTVL